MSSAAASTTDAIDRVAPTKPPNGRVAMRQNWHDLLFLHWVVPVEQLRPLLPARLEIDTFHGRAYIGLVPFTMTGVRPVWSPSVPFLSNFHETNVRTYVHLQGAGPGVWFFSLDAANTIAVRVARALWKLPYHYARMQLMRELNGRNLANATIQRPAARIEYLTERLWPGPIPGSCSVCYTPVGQAAAALPGTLEHFLAERYILYAGDNNRLFSGQVNHTPYPLQPAEVHSLTENLVAAAGIVHDDAPPLAHYSSGVRVRVFPLRRVPA